jgi:hypothetical protein
MKWVCDQTIGLNKTLSENPSYLSDFSYLTIRGFGQNTASRFHRCRLPHNVTNYSAEGLLCQNKL